MDKNSEELKFCGQEVTLNLSKEESINSFQNGGKVFTVGEHGRVS